MRFIITKILHSTSKVYLIRSPSCWHIRISLCHASSDYNTWLFSILFLSSTLSLFLSFFLSLSFFLFIYLFLSLSLSHSLYQLLYFSLTLSRFLSHSQQSEVLIELHHSNCVYMYCLMRQYTLYALILNIKRRTLVAAWSKEETKTTWRFFS